MPVHRRFRPLTAMVPALVALTLAVPVHAQVASPAGAIPPEALRARREALFAKLGAGVAIVEASRERDIDAGDYPQDSDYRENNDFFYLTGLEAKGSRLVLVASDSAPDRAVLFLPPRDPRREQWTGTQLDGAEAMRLSGVDETHSADSFDLLLPRLVMQARRGALYVDRGARSADSDAISKLVFGRGPATAIPVHDLRVTMGELRVVKDADELARLRRSITITTDAQKAAMAAAKPGMYEYELEAIIEATFRRQGAERVGFPTIVGSGPNSTTLHYDKNRRQTKAGDLVVMDIGAEYGYYSADVTRTIPVSGRFTPRQREIYDLVLASQQAAIDSVRPGMTVGRLNQIARDYMRIHSGTLCGAAPCDRYFIHGLSHWLGMDVHDVGPYARPLAPGMVLTVEPGIYIPEENLGVRIEDDVLVTATGGEILSAGAPRRAEDVERAMRGK